jgi:hypothetical protein
MCSASYGRIRNYITLDYVSQLRHPANYQVELIFNRLKIGDEQLEEYLVWLLYSTCGGLCIGLAPSKDREIHWFLKCEDEQDA